MSFIKRFGRVAFFGSFFVAVLTSSGEAVKVSGAIRDLETREILAARLYIEGPDGTYRFAESASPEGSAVRYNKQNQESVEKHTTLSAHPFTIDLPTGSYTFTAERGKEYLAATRTIRVESDPVEFELDLERWIDMAELGFYSGDTHVHRLIDELPNVLLAEDLNVAFPLSYWAWDAYKPPFRHDKSVEGPIPAEPVYVDPTHVYYAMNTEFEIGKVEGKQHTLGAFFSLNHKTPFEVGVPPVAKVGEMTHAQGGLLELDKHNWPWSMMLVPTMGIDLYELTNNHIWRTKFLFKDFGVPPPEYMNIEMDEEGMTEEGWIDFGFQNYYALLNCGFRLRPTAGTASGVHPVPLGFGRVYVQIEGEFSYEKWVEGLRAGRSFVTTGPMLRAWFAGSSPGKDQVVPRPTGVSSSEENFGGEVISAYPLVRLEVLANGEVVESIVPYNQPVGNHFINHFKYGRMVSRSTWFAARCYERTPEGRIRFAHSSPFFVKYVDRPLKPKKEEIEFLIGRMEEEIERNQGVLEEAGAAEYKSALEKFRTIQAGVE